MGTLGLVLLADDGKSPAFAQTSRAILEHAGWSVASAHSCEEVRATMATSRVDVLLTDESVGKRSAESILAELGDARPPIAVVVSGWGTAASFRRSEAAGFDIHIVKPGVAPSLEASVDVILRLLRDGKLRSRPICVLRDGHPLDLTRL
jgi:DNA-binding response OmpR family regulator